MGRTRRALLATIGTVGVAGCVRGHSMGRGDRPDGTPPTREDPWYVHWSADEFAAVTVSGGIPEEGIPAIDRPEPVSPDQLDLRPDDPVFGVVKNGEVRAYPRYILVYHEIVNDTLGGEPITLTYCPLTGTPQGFERGEASFGVTGELVNSNLIMYDRGDETWWPQIAATGIDGPQEDKSLREFRVYATTWERWDAAYPDTTVLSEETGHARPYRDDPYGDYHTGEGYYDSRVIGFDVLATDGRIHPKATVLGARTETGAVAFLKERVLEAEVLTATVGETPAVAVADPELATGHIYANPGDLTVAPMDEGYRVDGAAYAPDALPLEPLVTMDAMWFAWYAFYPTTSFAQ